MQKSNLFNIEKHLISFTKLINIILLGIEKNKNVFQQQSKICTQSGRSRFLR